MAKNEQVFVLSEGGHTITMDELNEFLNLWNKSCVTTSDFELFCARSKHIMALRISSYYTFVKRKNVQIAPQLYRRIAF